MMSADVPMTTGAARPGLRERLPEIPATVFLSMAWMGLMILVALFAHWLKPYTITQMDLTARLQPPALMSGTWAHPLGTDQLGRDVLARLIVSIRVSLSLAVSATILGVLFGGIMGLLAAHFRGFVEQLVLILIDVQAALPFIILALSALAFFGNSFLLLVFLLAFYGWERHARVVRGLALAAYGQGYMRAVEQLGAGPGRLYLRHMVPNMGATLVVSATLAFPEVILAGAGLSFLGLGIQPPDTDLGNMVGYGRTYLQQAPWVLLCPAAVIVLTTLAISMLGDWMRDQLDPGQRA